jgi:hypothetical protein
MTGRYSPGGQQALNFTDQPLIVVGLGDELSRRMLADGRPDIAEYNDWRVVAAAGLEQRRRSGAACVQSLSESSTVRSRFGRDAASIA